MKKIYLLGAVLCAIFTASVAEAKNQFYVGADALYSTTRHEFTDTSRDVAPLQSDGVMRGENFGAGINAGYKMKFGRTFIAPEIFYDYLNNKAKDFFHVNFDASNHMRVKDRVGAKLNVGYNIFSKLNIFVNAGLAAVHYSAENNTPFSSDPKSTGQTKVRPIYGIGLSYDFTRNWAARVSYDYQKFNNRYINPFYKDTVSLNVFKAGFTYSF